MSASEPILPLQRTRSWWHVKLHKFVEREAIGTPLPKWIARHFHPTSAILSIKVPRHRGPRKLHENASVHTCTSYSTQETDTVTIVKHLWTSRDHRKHRHVCYPPDATQKSRHSANIWVGLWHLKRVEYWNVSWWVAQAFTWGSVVWCLNGFFSLMPLLDPSTFGDPLLSAGWTAWVGATIFEFGSIFGMWEAWNRDDVASFGWNVVQKWQTIEHDVEAATGHLPRQLNGTLSKQGSRVENGEEKPTSRAGSPSPTNQTTETPSDKPYPETVSPLHSSPALELPAISLKRWVWWSSDRHYFREIGFLAAFFQMMGATIFWISGFTALPAIQEAIVDRTGVYDGIFWVPQVVGGMGFVISSLFIMLETQKTWYRPALRSLGWHVGFWNFIGGIGFTACGALGFAAKVNSGVNFQSVLCTFWGSWAFLIGSLLQWFESVNAV